MKKKPVSQWKDILHTLTGDDASSKVRMEAGVFQIGTNRYIDKLVFKCGSFQPEPDLPYTFVMGKKLKKGPESYEDVREAVVKDYLTVYEDAWLKDLKQKYKVEKNQERELCREKLDLVGYQYAQAQISTIVKQLEKAVRE